VYIREKPCTELSNFYKFSYHYLARIELNSERTWLDLHSFGVNRGSGIKALNLFTCQLLIWLFSKEFRSTRAKINVHDVDKQKQLPAYFSSTQPKFHQHMIEKT
jgi:hypothetical protein